MLFGVPMYLLMRTLLLASLNLLRSNQCQSSFGNIDLDGIVFCSIGSIPYFRGLNRSLHLRITATFLLSVLENASLPWRIGLSRHPINLQMGLLGTKLLPQSPIGRLNRGKFPPSAPLKNRLSSPLFSPGALMGLVMYATLDAYLIA